MAETRNAVAMQFDDAAQQHHAATIGMWIFLATEIMLFGGLFTGYAVYRVFYPDAFVEMSRHLDLVLGGVNTGVLLCSSLTMALGVHFAHDGAKGKTLGFLSATLLLGAIFLVIKGFEYHHEYVEGLVPIRGFEFHAEGVEEGAARLFMGFYFVMTGLHALHLIIGLGVLIANMLMVVLKEKFPARTVEISGLYWHLIDIVWVFLYPLLYLVR